MLVRLYPREVARQLRPRRRRLCLRNFFILLAICFSSYYYDLKSLIFPSSNGTSIPPTVIIHPPKPSPLTCYRDENKQNTIETLEEYLVPQDESFFFVETNCHENNELEFNPRQACSIESVARLNPNSSVYVLVPSPVHRLSNSAHMEALLQSYKNVLVRHVNMEIYLNRSPLGGRDWESLFRTSKTPVAHASDVLRYLTLSKFGGTYLDMDIILLKPFNRTNFAGELNHNRVGSAVLSINKDHPINLMNLENLLDNVRREVWTNSGQDVIYKSLVKLCGGIEKTCNMTDDQCGNFKVLQELQLYPVNSEEWSLLFDELVAANTLDEISDSFTVHVWNHASYAEKVFVGSKQPYAVIASKYCPKVYSTLKYTF